jgi:hypothetical protein
VTPDQFTTVCKRLFGRDPDGYGWQAAMHRQTGAPLTTIQKWAGGKNPIPAVVAALLRMVDRLNNSLKGKDHA